MSSFGNRIHSQQETYASPKVVEVSDSSDVEAKDASGAEGSEASFKSSVSGVELSREKMRRKVIALEESWSFESIRFSLFEVDLDSSRADYLIPDQVTLRVPDEGELPS